MINEQSNKHVLKISQDTEISQQTLIHIGSLYIGT